MAMLAQCYLFIWVPPSPSPPSPPSPSAAVSVVRHDAGGAAAPKAATAVEEGEAVPQPMLGKPFVEVQWEMLNHNPSILYFRALLLQIQVCSAARLRHLTMWSPAAWFSAALQSGGPMQYLTSPHRDSTHMMLVQVKSVLVLRCELWRCQQNKQVRGKIQPTIGVFARFPPLIAA